MKIWVDVDDVLSQTALSVLKYHNFVLDKQKFDSIEDWKHSWLIEANYPWISLSREEGDIEFFNKVFLSDVALDIPKVEKCEDIVKKISSKGYEMYAITARNLLVKEYTLSWIDKHFPWIFKDILFSRCEENKHKDKSILCRELWIDVMIEDNMNFALDIASAWIKVYLLEKPWNRDRLETHENIIKIKSWEEVIL